MNTSNKKYLITQSIVSACNYCLKSGDRNELISSLKRIKSQPTQAMLDGLQFENMVYECAQGKEIPEKHKWINGVTETTKIINGASYQVKVAKDIEVSGIKFVLYGIADFVKKGIVYDTKFSKTYRVGKYFESPQHSFYFELFPKAYRFDYLISDGKYVFRESYDRDCTPASQHISQFIKILKQMQLWDLYKQNWESKY